MANDTSVQTYLRQYIHTATGGKVRVEFAWGGDVERMQFRCTCGAIWRLPTPTVANEIPYEIQVWLKDHGPTGSHGKQNVDPQDPNAPKALTANFGGGVIDESSAKAAAIKAQAMKYKAEQEAVDLDKKIAILQQKEQEYKASRQAALNAANAAKQKIMLEMMDLMTKKKTLEEAVKVVYPPTVLAPVIMPNAPVAKPKKATIPQGRKFR